MLVRKFLNLSVMFLFFKFLAFQNSIGISFGITTITTLLKAL